MERLDCFQIYSLTNDLNLLVDSIWIKGERIFFRVLKEYSSPLNSLKKEEDNNVYSISINSIYSIRCKVYFFKSFF
jgi:hypothetical protein